MSGVGPSTPINVNREHVCHSETSVISLSALLHLTGTHQSLGEIGVDVPREAHLWLPSLPCVSVGETLACQEFAAASFAEKQLGCFHQRRGGNAAGILQLLHAWQCVRFFLGLTSATKCKANYLHRCTCLRSWASVRITGDAFTGVTTQSFRASDKRLRIHSNYSKHKLHLPTTLNAHT